MLCIFAPSVCAYDESLYGEFDFSAIYDAMGDDAHKTLGNVEDLSADTVSAKGLISYVLSALAAIVKPFLGQLGVLLVFLCAAAFVKRCSDGFMLIGTDKAISYAVILALSLLVYKGLSDDLRAVNEFLLNIRSYYASAVPIMTGMYALGGNTAVAAANGTVSTVVLSAVSFMCNDIVIPASRLCFALSLAGIDTAKTASVVKTLTGFCSKLMAVAMSLVASGMLLSVKLASCADGVGLRVLKFAASSFVPIIGGAIGEATATLTESVRVIRSGFGIFGIAAIFYMIVPVLVRVWASRLSLTLSAGLADILECKKEASFLKDCASVYSLSLSALIAISACFVLALTVFVNTAAVR